MNERPYVSSSVCRSSYHLGGICGGRSYRLSYRLRGILNDIRSREISCQYQLDPVLVGSILVPSCILIVAHYPMILPWFPRIVTWNWCDKVCNTGAATRLREGKSWRSAWWLFGKMKSDSELDCLDEWRMQLTENHDSFIAVDEVHFPCHRMVELVKKDSSLRKRVRFRA